MPRQTNIPEIRLNNIIACLTPIVSLLDDLHDGFGTPFVPAISSTTLSLISAVQTVKRNKDECIQFMEDIYRLLCAIINLHLMSETGGALSPQTLHHIGEFTETLHKIHIFVEAQVDGNKIKHFFRQSEMTSLLNDCHTRLQHTLEVFKIEGGLVSFTDIDEAQKKAQNGSSVDTSFTKGSKFQNQMYQTLTGSQNR
ncbi:hypothetical protein DFH09DRAFT_1354568 [Mycena vulgaris]|nr:hypothetical protein DFH09DRAFT_1354568 [Mycena vulgaris]